MTLGTSEKVALALRAQFPEWGDLSIPLREALTEEGEDWLWSEGFAVALRTGDLEEEVGQFFAEAQWSREKDAH